MREGVDSFPFGLYHLTASGETSWHELARHVVAKAIAADWKLQATPDRILPITTPEYPTPDARPANSRLNTSKFREAFCESDFDVLAEFEPGASRGVGLNFFSYGPDLEKILGGKVDFCSKLNKYIKPLVEKECLPLYEQV